MMKPEFSKPFDLAHAAAGAPVGKAGGGTARFVAYAEEADPSCCVVVIEDRFNLIGTRRKSGRVNETGATDNPNDLVMLPLGLIDGKPVFVGDLITSPDCKGDIQARPGMTFGTAGSTWAWPAPAKVYPETTMRHEEMFSTYSADLLSRGHTSAEAYSHGLAAVANAALRHACDTRQVVPQETHEAVLCLLAESMQGTGAATGDRAARDMAIAEAFINECISDIAHHQSEVERIWKLKIPTIISTVK